MEQNFCVCPTWKHFSGKFPPVRYLGFRVLNLIKVFSNIFRFKRFP